MTIAILTSQAEADAAFRTWADALLSESTAHSYGWTIEGKGVVFTNYGHGRPGTIENEVMLGADLQTGNGIVKIVKPETSQADKGKLTIMGRDAEGRTLLLREGWLKKNPLSREVRADFSALSGLSPIEVIVNGKPSTRPYYVVADLSASPAMFVSQTAAFATACARARSIAGGAKPPAKNQEPYTYALDEKGRVITVTRQAAESEICALQGYVSEALQAIIGERLTKPTRGGFAVDGLIQGSDLLVEIKTGTFAHDIYAAVGQLTLYPSLIGLPEKLDRALLIPDTPTLRPALAAAVIANGIAIYTYSVGTEGAVPTIAFSQDFLDRCG